MKGRKPLPSNVHFLHGNPSKLPDAALRNDFRPDIHLAKCPKHLNKVAKAEYLRLGRELERYGLVSDLDRGALAIMSVEWARHVWAEEAIERKAKGNSEDGGLIDRTPQGYRMQSAELLISRRSMEIYIKFAIEFGLTPSARTRVTPGADSGQGSLPGIEPKPDAPRLGLGSFA